MNTTRTSTSTSTSTRTSTSTSTSTTWALVLGSSLAALVGCGGSGKTSTDMAVPRDLSVPDLTLPIGAQAFGFVMDNFTLPMTKADFTWDVDGTGVQRNQLGDILFYLKQSGGDNPQIAVNDALVSGNLEQLFMVHTNDATLQNDPDVTINGYTGLAPVTDADAGTTDDAGTVEYFSGKHHFTLDLTEEPPAHSLHGAVNAGSADTLKLPPAAFPMHLPVGPGTAPPEMTLWATHMSFDVTQDSHGAFHIMNGLLHGGISKKQIDDRLIPAVARNLEYYVKRNPMAAGQLLGFFDKNNDGAISVDEVANNTIVSLVLTPDSDLFDADGNFSPNSDGEKDSVSLGVSFTAVGALFDEPAGPGPM